MPNCVECSAPVDSLYTEYGKGNIRLTQCEKCGRFADKYIEFDSVVIFLDMLLHKPQVYRHLFFNQEHKSPNEPKGSAARRTKNIFKLCLLLILFEVYIKWNAIDRLTKAKNLQGTAEFLRQYLYLFVICSLEFAIFQISVQIFSKLLLGLKKASPRSRYLIGGLVLSSFAKLLHIVMVVWDYHELEFSYLINLMVFTSNLEAISVIFDINHVKALHILGLSVGLKYAFQNFIGLYDAQFPLSLF